MLGQYDNLPSPMTEMKVRKFEIPQTHNSGPLDDKIRELGGYMQ
jgi:hypothetical protein